MGKLIGDKPLTNAEKQARHRERNATEVQRLRKEIEALKEDNVFLVRELRKARGDD